jgi:hypothetical protein
MSLAKAKISVESSASALELIGSKRYIGISGTFGVAEVAIVRVHLAARSDMSFLGHIS